MKDPLRGSTNKWFMNMQVSKLFDVLLDNGEECLLLTGILVLIWRPVRAPYLKFELARKSGNRLPI